MQRKYAKLDVVPGQSPQLWHVSQHDKRSRHIIFSLFARDGTLSLPSGTTATLEGRKPDGTDLVLSASLNNLAVTIDLPESAAETAGTIPCRILLKSGDKRLYTETFEIIADPDVKEA